jgi:hypothetical protein
MSKSADYHKIWTARNASNGLCRHCTKAVVPGSVSCAVHLEKNRLRTKAKSNERAANGICLSCLTIREPNSAFCAEHRKIKLAYHRNRQATRRSIGQCIQCSNNAASDSAWCEAHRDRRRETKLMRNYNIGASHRDAMVERQGGLCAICKTSKATRIDHNHTTGYIRGMLCDHCNTGLGLFKDSINNLLSAATYVQPLWSRSDDRKVVEVLR